jgi:Cys-rich four helix bundle protein (predicted Tat secretion target)
MERREFVTHLGLGIGATMGLAALGLTENQAVAAEPEHKHVMGAAKASPSKMTAVLTAALDCVRAGNICLAHCQRELAKGDSSLAECQKTVMNVVAVCESLAKVAAYNNGNEAHLKAYVKACAAICDDCAKACEQHITHHAECKDCYDSCKACIKACEALSVG